MLQCRPKLLADATPLFVWFQRCSCAFLVMSLMATSLVAQEKFTQQQLDFFETKVRPLLVEHCYECHGPEASPIEGGLSLSSRKAMIAGGDTGPAIIPGQSHESLLLQSINYEGIYEMPPDTKLADEQIETIAKWIDLGAPWPAAEDVAVKKKEFKLDERKASHWAWKPVRRPRLPKVKQTDWPKNPIDHFILEKLEAEELTPAPAADRRTLIRRAYFDLVGLPPTPEQVERFVSDPSEDAFEKVVDELLESPHFGERWARHWMDLVRYAETYGHEFDYPIPYPHQYRDYLIRAINADVSYKQLIEEHIAGDLLKNPRRHPELEYNESKIGTGFWFFGEAKHAAVDSRGEEAGTFDNQIDVMSKSFLGLTVACARCHDHKFDAISTADYYALAGFLKSSRRERMVLDPNRKIEKAKSKFEPQLVKADQLASQLLERTADIDQSKLANYFEAATRLAPQKIKSRIGLTIEGETLRSDDKPSDESKSVSGVIEVQTIKPERNFRWSQDQQIWWRDGKVGETWNLEFEIPKNADKAKANLMVTFTIAPDYGAAQILVDDKSIHKRVDFYANKLATKAVDLGQLNLASGKHRLSLKLLKPHPKAIARNMLGVDQLSLKSAVGKIDADRLKRVATKCELDPAVLKRLVEQVCSDAAKKVEHPLQALRKWVDLTVQGKPVSVKELNAGSRQQFALDQRKQSFLKESVLFEDFNDALPDFWSTTGHAFPKQPAVQPSVSVAGSLFQSEGTISSGKFGGNFYGALRSPSFELKHDRIHYRIKGHNVTVRLIIDGFFMDEYNALLYRDCKKTIPSSEQFIWMTQAGDIKNYRGRRAHIEVLDHGNGYVELDEIRFSNSASPPGPLPYLAIQCLAEENTAKQVASKLAAKFKQVMTEGGQPQSEVISWVVSNDLTACFGSLAAQNAKTKNQGESFVSTRSNSVAHSGEPTSLPTSLSTLAEELKTVHRDLRKSAGQVPRPMMALGMADGHGEEEHVFVRGNHKNLGEVVERRFLSALSKRPINPKDSSGRLQLARKITAPINPLTSRVAVNRIWHHLLGRGIVASVDNFGVLGKQPTHPELLDHLASEFVRDGWSTKRMIRTIMLSKTYQMSSKLNPDAKEKDPDNLLLHRAQIKRMQGEIIRDNMLAISGRLDRTMFGQSVPVYLTPFMSGRGRPRNSGPLDGNGRRSLYIEVRRNFLSPMMLAFDTPIPFNTIGRRNQSNVPAQALILMNSPLVESQAKLWAEQLVKANEPSQQRIRSIYQSAFSRPPTDQESQVALQFLETQAKELNVPEDKIGTHVELWKDLCHVIFNVKEFIYIQ